MTCPLYCSKVNQCFVKITSNTNILSHLTSIPLNLVDSQWSEDCKGIFANCSFVEKTTEEIKEQAPEIPETKEEPVIEIEDVKVRIFKLDNPYLVKADVIVYPNNMLLNIDDPLLTRMTKNKMQDYLDKIKRPIKMGSVHETDSFGIVPKKVFHAVIAGESRLVSEEDIRICTRKSLLLAEEAQARTVLYIPFDCGTHDILDTARTQLAAIKTYLKQNKNLKYIKNIFIVMEDEESYNVFMEYYNRIFK